MSHYHVGEKGPLTVTVSTTLTAYQIDLYQTFLVAAGQTLTLPAAPRPAQRITVTSTGAGVIVAAGAGTTIEAAASVGTLGAGSTRTFQYNLATTNWVQVAGFGAYV